MTRLRVPAILILTTVISTTCLLPPMDADLSRAYKTAKKMKLEVEIGPMYIDRSLSGMEVYYLPSKTADQGLGNGLIVGESENSLELGYLVSNTVGEPNIDYWAHYDIDNSNSKLYNYQIHMQKVFPASGFDVFVLHDRAATDLFPNDYRRLRHDPNFIADDLNEQWINIVPPTGTLAGLSFHDEDDTRNETLAILEYDTASDFYDNKLPGSGFDGFGGFTWDGPIVLPGAGPIGFFHYNPVTTTRIYSSYVGGEYLTYRWDGALIAQPLPLDDKVDRLLSNDYLYVSDDKEDTVYDRDGDKKYEFASGDLYLAYERFVGGIPTLFFTLVIFDRTGGGDDDTYIRVYSLPTSDLGDLD